MNNIYSYNTLKYQLMYKADVPLKLANDVV